MPLWNIFGENLNISHNINRNKKIEIGIIFFIIGAITLLSFFILYFILQYNIIKSSNLERYYYAFVTVLFRYPIYFGGLLVFLGSYGYSQKQKEYAFIGLIFLLMSFFVEWFFWDALLWQLTASKYVMVAYSGPSYSGFGIVITFLLFLSTVFFVINFLKGFWKVVLIVGALSSLGIIGLPFVSIAYYVAYTNIKRDRVAKNEIKKPMRYKLKTLIMTKISIIFLVGSIIMTIIGMIYWWVFPSISILTYGRTYTPIGMIMIHLLPLLLLIGFLFMVFDLDKIKNTTHTKIVISGLIINIIGLVVSIITTWGIPKFDSGFFWFEIVSLGIIFFGLTLAIERINYLLS